MTRYRVTTEQTLSRVSDIEAASPAEAGGAVLAGGGSTVAVASSPAAVIQVIELPEPTPDPAQETFPMFGARLTNVSGKTVPDVDAVSDTLWLAPHCGTKVPVLDANGAMKLVDVTSGPTDGVGFAYALGNMAAGVKCDAYVLDGADRLVLGPPWINGTQPVADARRYGGFPVNAAPMTCRKSDGSTVLVDPYRGTYYGTVQVAKSQAGKIAALMLRGFERECGIWNFYNREELVLRVGGNVPGPGPNGCFHWDASTPLQPIFGDARLMARVLVGRVGPRPLLTIDYGRRRIRKAYAAMISHWFGVGWDSIVSTGDSFTGNENNEFAMGLIGQPGVGWASQNDFYFQHTATSRAVFEPDALQAVGSHDAAALEKITISLGQHVGSGDLGTGYVEAWHQPSTFTMSVRSQF